MIKEIFISTLFFLSFITVFAQADIQFEINEHDFGNVKEGERPSMEFHFTNTGDDTLVLSNVKPSCGCTSPFWTKDPILPGEDGSIRVSYNSKNRPGSFYKAIKVTSNAKTGLVELKIKGIVDRLPDTTYSEQALANSPVLTLSRETYNFGNIEKHKRHEYALAVTNTGKSPLVIEKLEVGCHCVQLKFDKQSIAPGESADITLIYTPVWAGAFSEIIAIYSNDLMNPYVNFTIKAKVVNSLATPSMMNSQHSFGF